MRVLARGKSASAVAASAYISRERRHDHRTGHRYGYAKRGGLICSGVVNWKKTGGELWNAAEKAEKRCNARTGREIKIALPAELTADQMLALVKSFALHLKDKYGVASEFAIHAPRWLDERFGTRMEAAFARGSLSAKELHQIRRDGTKTNRNYHAHIMITTRSVDGETRVFGDKTRVLDDVKKGPQEMEALRAEWTKRTNAALRRVGHIDNVDLRSHDRRAATGDGPVGLESEPHYGPRAAAESAHVAERNQRLRAVGAPEIYSTSSKNTAVRNRKRETRARNTEIQTCWLELRRLERERARLLRSSAKIADDRERERKEEAKAEIAAVMEAHSAEEKRVAFEAAGSVFATDARYGVDAINRRYSDCAASSDDNEKEPLEEKQAPPSKTNGKVGEGEPMNEEVGNEETELSLQDIIDDVEAGRAPALAEEFELEIDMETYVAPSCDGPPPTFVVTKADLIRSAQRSKQRQHTRFD